MIRERLSLDGAWQFIFDKNHAGPPPAPDASWRETDVPAPWQAQFDDLRLSHGTGWYRRTFETPASWRTQAVVLHFGAVNYHAQVWLNGQLLGEHEGGYLPFEFDISSQLKVDQPNELLVRAHLPGWGDPNIPFGEIPHGKQSWYGPLGGIWQSVWVERRPGLHLTGLWITPRGDEVHVRATTNHPLPEGETFTLEITNPSGETAARIQTSAPEAVIPIPNPLSWSPDTPHLYTLKAALNADSLSTTFGFRTIETRDGRLLLNGQPLYLRGALDQDYYPDGINTSSSVEFLKDQIRKAKAMGLNCLRVHIKIPDPRYFEVADQLGMLIWAELPNWETLTAAAAERGKATLEGMLKRDWNHPSIIIWTIINEAWGTELDTNLDHRAWLEEMYGWLKALDPTRLVVDNSPCFPNFHIRSDLDDFHYYTAMPDGADRWDAWVNDFASRPEWLCAPDHASPHSNPLLVSEFGNWGLPDVGRLLSHYHTERGSTEPKAVEPWWFETGWDWRPGDVYPHGVMARFRELHLDKVFGDLAGLARASQWAQYEAMKYEIETMRLHPSISGYVITEFTDVHWECNGLLDLLRTPKVYFDRMADLQAELLVIPRPERRAWWVGETCQVNVSLSNIGPAAFTGSLVWALHVPGLDEIHGQAWNLSVPSFETVSLAPIKFPIPPIPAPVRATLQFTLRDQAGTMVSQTDLPLDLFPRPAIPRPLVTCPDPTLSQTLSNANYPISNLQSFDSPLLLTTLDAHTLRDIQQGRRALLLAETPDAVQSRVPRLQLEARAGTSWAGDWASAFAWFRRDRFREQIPGDGRLDFTFSRVFPETVIASVRTKDFEHEVLAGMFVGWLRSPAALIQKIPVGRGVLLICTLKLKDHLGSDPIADVLFQVLLSILV